MTFPLKKETSRRFLGVRRAAPLPCEQNSRLIYEDTDPYILSRFLMIFFVSLAVMTSGHGGGHFAGYGQGLSTWRSG